MPRELRGIVAWVVPAVEVFAAVFWFGGRPTRFAKHFVLLILSVILIAYVIQVVFGSPPQCNCFGILSRYVLFRDEAIWHLGTVATMALSVAMCPLEVADRSVRTHSRDRQLHSEPATRGFSLVEMIVVITVLAVLVSLAVPLLRSSKGAAERTINLEHLRNHALIFSQYTCDYRDAFPTPSEASPPPPYRWTLTIGDLGSIEQPYFVIRGLWPALMAELYYDSVYTHPSFSPPRFGRGLATPYEYSSVFLTDPAFWRYETRIGPTQWRATRAYEVLFPSAKVLLENRWFATIDESSMSAARAPGCTVMIHYVTSDGAASSLRSTLFLPPYRTGEGDSDGAMAGFGIPGLHTMEGVHGRDITR